MRNLHNLVVSQKNHHKGVYFDGHERSDVVKFRNDFVSKIKGLEPLCERPGYTPVVSEGQRPIIVIHHDESTFYSNADQSNFWSDGEMTVLKQKSLGQAIMVSDFIEEAGGDFLHHDDKHAHLLNMPVMMTNMPVFFSKCKPMAILTVKNSLYK